MLTRPHKRSAPACPPLPPMPFIKLMDKIKEPRKGILTKLEFGVLSIIGEAQQPLDAAEIAARMQKTKAGTRTSNYYRQVDALVAFGCIERQQLGDTLTFKYKVTKKGEVVLKKAVQLVLAMDG